MNSRIVCRACCRKMMARCIYRWLSIVYRYHSRLTDSLAAQRADAERSRSVALYQSESHGSGVTYLLWMGSSRNVTSGLS